MKTRYKIKKIIATTMVIFMLPWSSFGPLYDVHAGSPDEPGEGYESGNTDNIDDFDHYDNTDDTYDDGYTDDSDYIKNNEEEQGDFLGEDEEELESLFITTNWVLDSDCTVASIKTEGEVTVDLNGHTLEVVGNYVQQSGNLNINSGKLKVKGSAEIYTLNVNKGQVDISKDLTVHDITMLNKEDTVNVFGNLIYGYNWTNSSILQSIAKSSRNIEDFNKIIDDSYQGATDGGCELENFDYETEESDQNNAGYDYETEESNQDTDDYEYEEDNYDPQIDNYVQGLDNYNVKGVYYYNSQTGKYEIETEEYGWISVKLHPTYLKSGTLTVGGDFTSYNDGFWAKDENKVILNGSKKQTIQSPFGHFATLELQNYSEEGVYSKSTLSYDKLITNGCKLTYSCGDVTEGFVLKEDRTFSGDLLLANGEIDLNGHTLTVDGNLIHAGGRININNGKLIIKKDLREQIPFEDEFLRGDGSLCLSNDKDEIIVYGDAYLDSDVTFKMQKGSLIVNGDIHTSERDTYFDFGTKIILNSSESQTVDYNVKGFKNLEINTKDTITFENGYITVTGSLKSTCKNNETEICVTSLNNVEYPYYGDLYLSNGYFDYKDQLKKDVLIYGNLSLGNSVELSGKSITVNNLDISGSSSLIMNNEKDYIKVLNDMKIYSVADSMTQSHYPYFLTDGIIEISGNFSCSNNNFVASGNHKVIFSPVKDENGEYINQEIIFGRNSKSKFNILVLRGNEYVYSFDNDLINIANQTICEYDDTKFLAVTDLTVVKVTEKTATFSFVDNNDPKSAGYEIYRDGELIATTDKTEFTDTDLTPETKYEYSVYAFDTHKILSEASDVLSVQTLKDEEKPTEPKSVNILSRTGSTVTLKWSASKDNVGVVRYIVYRNGKAIEENLKTTEYVDKGLVADEIYTYEVSAVDAAGNESEKCDALITTVASPKITRVTPDDYDKIGGKTVKLKVYYKNYGINSKNSVNIFYKNNNEWVKINDSALEQTNYSSSEYVSTYDWDISGFESKSIEVKFELTDASNDKSVYETEYDIDHTAPASPTKLTAEDINGVAKLEWKVSGEADFAKYKVYRYVINAGDETELTELAEITDKYENSYRDNTLKEGTEARYYVSAVDNMGNESSLSDYVTITVGRDKQSPEITNIVSAKDRISGVTSIKAFGKDNKEISEIIFYILSEKEYNKLKDETNDKTEDKIKDASSWTEIGRSTDISVENGRFVASINLDTTKFEDGIYFIAAIAKDSSDNFSNDINNKRYEIDNSGIEKININKKYNDFLLITLENIKKKK